MKDQIASEVFRLIAGDENKILISD